MEEKYPYRYYEVPEYAKLHIIRDKNGNIVYKLDKNGNRVPRTLTPQAIYQKLERGEIKYSRVPQVFGFFIDVEKYPPVIGKPGRKKTKKTIQEYIQETKELAPQNMQSKESFVQFCKERYEKVKDQMSLEYFMKLISQ